MISDDAHLVHLMALTAFHLPLRAVHDVDVERRGIWRWRRRYDIIFRRGTLAKFPVIAKQLFIVFGCRGFAIVVFAVFTMLCNDVPNHVARTAPIGRARGLRNPLGEAGP